MANMGQSNSINDFHIDLEYSLEQSECELFDKFYKRIFPTLKEVQHITDLVLQKKGIDKIIILNTGQQITIDEKKRRRDYGDILLEIWSVSEKHIEGWLTKDQCDYIVYAIMPTLKVYLLPTILLRKAWFANQEQWDSDYPRKNALNKDYTTISIAIPIKVVLSAIKEQMEQSLTA